MKSYSKMPKGEKKLVDFLGWYGMVMVLIAYAMVTYGYLTTQSVSWQVMNLTGSAGLAVNALSRKALPEVWLNLIFAVVALSGIYQILRG